VLVNSLTYQISIVIDTKATVVLTSHLIVFIEIYRMRMSMYSKGICGFTSIGNTGVHNLIVVMNIVIVMPIVTI
jgi:hypothetical protein